MIRFPAEWEHQSFLQFTFPHRESDWKYMLPEITNCFIDIIEQASRYQDILVVSDNITRVRSFFNSNNRIYYTSCASNDTWARDHGGITIFENNLPIILDYTFNGWGNKFDPSLDNKITSNLWAKNIFLNCNYRKIDFVLEGGALESNGSGTILTTSHCLLSPNRNPGFSKQQIESHLTENFGTKKILWLDHGALTGDDTDSHIDTLARFINPETIIFTACCNKKDEHYENLSKMKDQVKQFRTERGKPYNLVELPMPDACYNKDGMRLPATYANFTIINDAVLLPLYNVDQDKDALGILKKNFPTREVIGINCRPVIEQHGSLHCLTMQYPTGVELNKEILTCK